MPGLFAPHERRAAVVVLVALALATAGTLAVAAGLSTTTGYDLRVGEPVADVPSDARVVEYDRLDPATRRMVTLAARTDGAAAVAVSRRPDRDLLGAGFVEYRGSYRPLGVEARQALAAPGTLALGAVYLLALVVAALLPGVRALRRSVP